MLEKKYNIKKKNNNKLIRIKRAGTTRKEPLNKLIKKIVAIIEKKTAELIN